MISKTRATRLVAAMRAIVNGNQTVYKLWSEHAENHGLPKLCSRSEAIIKNVLVEAGAATIISHKPMTLKFNRTKLAEAEMALLATAGENRGGGSGKAKTGAEAMPESYRRMKQQTLNGIKHVAKVVNMRPEWQSVKEIRDACAKHGLDLAGATIANHLRALRAIHAIDVEIDAGPGGGMGKLTYRVRDEQLAYILGLWLSRSDDGLVDLCGKGVPPSAVILGFDGKPADYEEEDSPPTVPGARVIRFSNERNSGAHYYRAARDCCGSNSNPGLGRTPLEGNHG